MKYPYQFSMAGVIFFSAVGMLIGIIIGFGIARHIYRTAGDIETRIAENRVAVRAIKANNKPFNIGDSRFTCQAFQLSIAGAGSEGRYQDFGK